MSSTTFLDICGLDFCSEDGGVKGGGRRVEDCFGVLAGRIVLAVGLVLAGGVRAGKSIRLSSALRTHRRKLVSLGSTQQILIIP